MIEFFDQINKYLPLISAVGFVLFTVFMYKFQGIFRKEMADMKKGIEDDIKGYIDIKFLEHTNDELKDAVSRKQRYIDELESRIDKTKGRK